MACQDQEMDHVEKVEENLNFEKLESNKTSETVIDEIQQDSGKLIEFDKLEGSCERKGKHEESAMQGPNFEPFVHLNKRLFSRDSSAHTLVASGQYALTIFWTNKKPPANILVGATVIWLLFEYFGCHFLTLICQMLMLGMTICFLWTNVSTMICNEPIIIPKIEVPEELFRNLATQATRELDNLFSVIRDLASSNDLKKFLLVIASLWIFSIIGSWMNFLSLLYFATILAYTIPQLHEKYEVHLDEFVVKVVAEGKKYYRTLEKKVLTWIPSALSKKTM